MAKLKTVDEVIKALGGTGAVAELVDVADQTVSTWKARGFFPAWICGTLQQACEENKPNKIDADPALFQPRRPAAA